eukprot:5850-Pelagomonas_calceolata.AAC.2
MHKDVVIIDADVILRNDVASVFTQYDFDVAVTVTHEGRTLYSMHINVGVKFFKNVAQHTIDLWFDLAQEYLVVRARPTPPTWWLVLFYGTGAENQRIIESWTHLVEPYTAKYYKGVKFCECTSYNHGRTLGGTYSVLHRIVNSLGGIYSAKFYKGVKFCEPTSYNHGHT